MSDDAMETGGDDDGPFNIYLHKNGCLTWSFAPNDPPHGYTIGEGEIRYIRYDLHKKEVDRLNALERDWAKFVRNRMEGESPR